MRDTRSRLIEKYHSLMRRPSLDDDKARKVMIEVLTKNIGRFIPPNKSARILDIACGEGIFLMALREKGYNSLSGFDLSDENVAICHKLGLDFVVKFDALELINFSPGHKYDVIFALDILEHLPKNRVVEFLGQVYQKLSPGGHVVIQTPNMGSLQGLFIRYNDLTHEFGLTEFSARSLMLASGWHTDDIQIYPTWNATTFTGYLREWYLRLLHRLIFLSEGAQRPRIPSKNLLIVGRRSQ